jgi:hypothetical protein
MCSAGSTKVEKGTIYRLLVATVEEETTRKHKTWAGRYEAGTQRDRMGQHGHDCSGSR